MIGTDLLDIPEIRTSRKNTETEAGVDKNKKPKTPESVIIVGNLVTNGRTAHTAPTALELQAMPPLVTVQDRESHESEAPHNTPTGPTRREVQTDPETRVREEPTN